MRYEFPRASGVIYYLFFFSHVLFLSVDKKQISIALHTPSLLTQVSAAVNGIFNQKHPKKKAPD